MKIFTSILLYFCIVISFACAETENLNAPEAKSQSESTQNLQSNFDEPILEITSDFVGMMWMNGKVIDFRLFENGTVEYDAYPKTSSTQLKAEEIKPYNERKLVLNKQKNL